MKRFSILPGIETKLGVNTFFPKIKVSLFHVELLLLRTSKVRYITLQLNYNN